MGAPQFVDRIHLEPELPAADAEVTALLFCAEEDQAALETIGPMLTALGMTPRIVPGVELDVRILGDTLSLLQGPAVATIVVSEHLDRHQAHRLAETFAASKGRSHRLLVLEMRPGRASGLARSLGRAAQSLRSTMEIDRTSRARLSSSAGVSPSARGESRTPLSSVETISLRVYRDPVVVSDSLRDDVGVIPAHVRVPATIHRSRRLAPPPSPSVVDRAAADTRPDMSVAAVLGAPEPELRAAPPLRRTAPSSRRRAKPWLVLTLAAAATLLCTAAGVLAFSTPSKAATAPQRVAGLQLMPIATSLPGAVAAQRCDGMAGSGWHVPTADELAALEQAGALEGHAYWSRATPQSPMLVQWRASSFEGEPTEEADGVCVRRRPEER